MPHARIGEALRALVFEREPGVELHQVLDRYYAPDNTHRTNGKALNRGERAEMVAHVRNQVTGGTVTVLNEVSDGATYAERYVFHIDLANGTAQDRGLRFSVPSRRTAASSSPPCHPTRWSGCCLTRREL